jgi:hypothetical protein
VAAPISPRGFHVFDKFIGKLNDGTLIFDGAGMCDRVLTTGILQQDHAAMNLITAPAGVIAKAALAGKANTEIPHVLLGGAALIFAPAFEIKYSSQRGLMKLFDQRLHARRLADCRWQ